MRIAFAGTPEFAAVALRALHAAGHDIVLVLTQPDRPAGRGMKLQTSAVKQTAQDLGLALAQPRGLRLDGKFSQDAAMARQSLSDAAPAAMVVAAYGLILPPWVLGLPAKGCINIHASLLPRWRGAAPIHRAIEAGDAQTGITIMQMDEGLDTGAMLLQAVEPIAATDTTGGLHDRLARLGGQMIVQTFEKWDELLPQAQPVEGVTYAHKISKEEAALDLRLPATVLERKLRALDPFPGCQARLAWGPLPGQQGLELKVWRARVVTGRGEPGQFLAQAADRWVVACGEDALELLEVQQSGGRRMAAADLLRGLDRSDRQKTVPRR